MSEVRKDAMCGMPKIKVYRNTFSLNRSMQEEMLKLDTAIVPLFKDPHIVDITFPYTKDFKKELHIPKDALYKGKPRSRIAYLCASNGWIGSLLHGQSSMVKTLSLRIYKKDPSCGLPLTSEDDFVFGPILLK